MPNESIFNFTGEERLKSAERSELYKTLATAAVALGFYQPERLADLASQLADQKEVRTAQKLADWFMKTATLSPDQQASLWKYWNHQWLIGSNVIRCWIMQLEENQRRAFFTLAESQIRGCGLPYSLPELAKLIQSPLPPEWKEPAAGSLSLDNLLRLAAKNNGKSDLRQPAKAVETVATTSALPKAELLAEFNAGMDQIRKQLSLMGGQLELVTKSCARSEAVQGDLKTTLAQSNQQALEKIKATEAVLQKTIITDMGSRLEAVAKSCVQQTTAQAELKTFLQQHNQPVLEVVQKLATSLQKQHEQRQVQLQEQAKVRPQPVVDLPANFPDWLSQYIDRQTQQLLDSNRVLRQSMRLAMVVWIVAFFLTLGVILASR